MKNKNLMKKIDVTAVSFLNTLPFIYGLQDLNKNNNFNLVLTPPSKCADLAQKEIPDIVLIPVGAIDKIKNYTLIDGYCLGTQNIVRSVLLLSNSPIEKINKIHLDSQSVTSNLLVQILAKHYWKVDVQISTDPNYDDDLNEAIVSIGDKAFSESKNFMYSLDLAEQWYEMTNLPFVFAVWMYKEDISQEFLKKFKDALQSGIDSIDDVIKEFDLLNRFPTFNIEEYLKNNMNYILDDKKKEAMSLFSKLTKEL